MHLHMYKDKKSKSNVIVDYILRIEKLEEQAKIISILEKIDELGARYLLIARDLFTKKIEDDLFELKVARHRFLYCYKHGNNIYIVHAFYKDTKKTPKKEKIIARKRIKEIMKME